MHKFTLFCLSIYLLFFISCDENSIQKHSNNKIQPTDKTFDLTGIFNQRYKFSVNKTRIKLTTNKPIIIVNLFKPSCQPCIQQMKNLDQLQKEYHQNIFTLSLSIKETKQKELLALLATYNLHYFIANFTQESKRLATLLKKQVIKSNAYTLPLTIIYLKGKYFTHYEGVIPLEMMRYDLAEAQKNLKSKKLME